jgi:hypothetical protein
MATIGSPQKKNGYLAAEGNKTIDCSTTANCSCDTSLTLSLDHPRCDPDTAQSVSLPVIVKDNITNQLIEGALVTLILTSQGTQIQVELHSSPFPRMETTLLVLQQMDMSHNPCQSKSTVTLTIVNCAPHQHLSLSTKSSVKTRP